MQRGIILKHLFSRTISQKLFDVNQAAGYAKNVNVDIKAESEPEIPTNVIKNLHAASEQRENGKIYDKRPFKFRCVKDKVYFWCLCGQSKNQPFCDGTHRNPHLQIKLRPIRFSVAETKEYWLCNCKQTSNRPFCDGTHKREDIQAAVKH